MLIFVMMVGVVFAAVRTTVDLSWTYSPSEVSNVTFNIYFSTNVALPTTNWTLITNISGTNVTIQVSPGQGFYFATASNAFGESLPSNTAQVTIPRNINSLTIK